MRYLLYLLWSLISLLVIVLVAVTLLLTVYNDELETKLVQKIELTTQRNIEIQGGFGFRMNPRPTVYVKGVKMANAEWAKQPWMLEIDELMASLSLRGLLRGDIDLREVHAKHAKILVEQDPISQKINWAFSSGGEPKIFKRLAERLHIHKAKIEDTQISINVGSVEHFIDVDEINGETNYFNKSIKIKGLATLHDKPVQIDLGLSSLRNMLLRVPTRLNFNGTHGVTQIKGRGEIRDLLRWRGHDIKLEVATPSLIELQPWLTSKLIETPPMVASAQFVQVEGWRSAKLDKINVVSVGLEGKTEISGRVAQLRNWNGIDLHGTSHYPLASILRWKELKSETDAVLHAEYHLTGNKQQALGLEVQSATLKGEGISVQGSGKIAHLLQQNTEGIPFKVHADSLDLLGLIPALQWIKTDALDGTLALKIKQGRLALEEIKLSTFGGRANISGLLDDLTGEQRGHFELDAKMRSKDMQLINRLNVKKYPVFKQTKVTARINTERAEVSAPEMQLRLIAEGLKLTAEGEIPNLKTLQAHNIRVSMQADSIAKINQQFETKIFEMGTLVASGIVTGNIDNAYNINKLKMVSINGDQQLNATGNVSNLGPDMKADMAVEADIQSLDNLPELFDSSFNAPTKLRGKGRATVRSTGLKDWSIKQITLSLEGSHQGTITGSIVHLPDAAEYTLFADMQRLTMDGLADIELIKTLAPENVRVYAEINKSADEANFSLNNIDGQMNLASGSASVNIAGNVANINQLEGLSLMLGITAAELKRVPFLSDLSLKSGVSGVASVKLSGKSDDMDVFISSVNIGKTDVQGELNVKLAKGDKPRITGKLNSNNLDILALIQREKRKRMFSDTPLSLAWLNDFDIDLSVNAGRLNVAIAELQEAMVQINLENGVLSIPNTRGAVGEGKMQMWLTVDAQRLPYNIIVAIKGETIKPEFITLFGESEFIRGGVVDIDIGLGGVGTSITHYMDNAYGKIQLQLHNSTLKNQNLELFGADLVTGILDIINPFSRQAAYLPIECGVIHFPVVKGDALAAQGIAIKTDKVTVLGGGVINLGSEALEILIKPKPRRGLGLSAGTLTNIAKISGSFAKPKVTLDSTSLLQTTAAIGAAIFSGGWTLLAQGLLDRNKANSDVCEQTLLEPNKTFSGKAKERMRNFNFDR